MSGYCRLLADSADLVRTGHRVWVTRLFVALAWAALLVGQTALGQQGHPSERERDLERLVRELSERVLQLEGRLNELESTRAAATSSAPEPLGNRMDRLEKSVQEIRKSPPPSADSEEWAHMRDAVEAFSAANTLRPYWKDGLRFDSLDGSFKLRIGGRIQYDWGFFTADDEIEDTVGSLDDGTEARRARIYLSGTIYDNISFKAQYDFAGGDADFKDVYMELGDVPVVGNIRIGHFKEPFSLEELTSSSYMTFMERSLANTFSPDRNSGFMLHNHMLDQRMTWAVGFFRETDDFGDGAIKRDYNVTTRLTGLPWYAEEGRKLVHLGIGYTHKNYEDDTARFRSRPEAHLSPRFVDTGVFPAEYADIIGAEAALVYGPFSLQGEYVQAFVESRVTSDPTFWGAYLQAGYLLTGEHRPYSTATGTFSRLEPRRDFGKDGGRGAWELAARYSHVDLNNARVRGGELRDLTFGLNWYLNPNMRIMWNYVRADLTRGGDANIYQMRFQLAF